MKLASYAECQSQLMLQKHCIAKQRNSNSPKGQCIAGHRESKEVVQGHTARELEFGLSNLDPELGFKLHNKHWLRNPEVPQRDRAEVDTGHL